LLGLSASAIRASVVKLKWTWWKTARIHVGCSHQRRLLRQSAIIAIMPADGFGQPTAPYYILKRIYENTHIALNLAEPIWAPGERVALEARVPHCTTRTRDDHFGGVQYTFLISVEAHQPVRRARRSRFLPDSAEPAR
jgi:hypothetical protein